MAEHSTPTLHHDEHAIFVIKHQGKLFVTSGAFVYDPAAAEPTQDEREAMEYLEHALGSKEVADLSHTQPPINHICVVLHSIENED